MRANLQGTVEVILNLVFPDLTKDLSFLYIPALPSCFNCMNEGHLEWLGHKRTTSVYVSKLTSLFMHLNNCISQIVNPVCFIIFFLNGL